MRVCLMIEVQEDVSWPEWLAVAESCEDSGIEALLTSDHYLSVFGHHDRACLDAWTVLAGIAACTERIRLGTMVSPVTFRHPSQLAKTAVTVDHISQGRVELGLGAGWWEEEHRAYGFPFGTMGDRIDRLEEQLEIIHRTWTESATTFEGRHYRLDHCPGLPKAIRRPHPPLIVAGRGLPRTIAAAVRWADEYNAFAVSPTDCAGIRSRLARSCDARGRDPATISFSVAARCVVGADMDDVEERDRLIFERTGSSAFQKPASTLSDVQWLAGTVAEVVARLEEYAEAGVDRFVLQHLLHDDLESIRLVGQEIAPAVA